MLARLLWAKWLRLVSGMLVSLLFLWLSLKDTQLPAITAVLSQADYRFIVPAVVTVLVVPLARARRWQLLFYPDQHKLRLSRLYSVVIIGQLVNVVSPARLGEGVRAYLVGKMEEKSTASALGTIVVEKSVDVLVLSAMFLALVILMPIPSWLHGPRVSLIAAGLGVLLVALVSSAKKGRGIALLERLLRLMPDRIRVRVTRYADLIQSRLIVLLRPGVGLPVVGWSILVWSLGALVNYLVFAALRLDLSFLAAGFVLLVLQLGIAVPSSPGKVGIFHYLCVTALSVFSVEKSLALSYATLLHIVVVLPPSLLGAFLIWRESLGHRAVERTAIDSPAGT